MQTETTITTRKSISFGQVLVGALHVLVAVGEVQNRRDNAAITQSSESSEWEERKLNAMASIERGLRRELDKAARSSSYIARSKADEAEQRAAELRSEVRKHCDERNNYRMERTEDSIRDFFQYGW